jgi:hypothetical protein
MKKIFLVTFMGVLLGLVLKIFAFELFTVPTDSDYGCCGNYAGCCYLWNPLCLIHDLHCKKCKPRWYCFDGCIPDLDDDTDDNPDDIEIL